ncbi:MAG TPA: thioredoxin family protein [Candidatus Acidoferrum sp.]|nr:thioredoxin family protein [Candidatus Acidoferrum sp.]
MLGLVLSAMLTLPVEGTFPSLGGAVTWFNSKPLTPAELRGKVVLVEFWTYTCVNWLRTLPYERAWAQKYKDQGFVVIGVHTPEFSFERDLDNIEHAIKTMDITFPVAVDSNYAIWNAFDNNYWPAMYFIDAQGRIRHHHYGEGAYDESERVIRALLAEAGHKNVSQSLVAVEPRGLEVAADWPDVQSPENYLGAERTTGFVPNAKTLRLNEWTLTGDWSHSNEAVVVDKAGGTITYRFHARDVNLIMSPPTRGGSVRFRVLLDGKPPGDAHGGDSNAEGYGTATRQGTYQLIRQHKPIVERTFEIEFLDPGAAAYDFTFG